MGPSHGYLADESGLFQMEVRAGGTAGAAVSGLSETRPDGRSADQTRFMAEIDIV